MNTNIEKTSVPKKRGRKPKPKPDIPINTVPKKRGRKPKVKPIVDSSNLNKNNINDQTEHIILHIPLSEKILLNKQDTQQLNNSESSTLQYMPNIIDPKPFEPNAMIEKEIGMIKTNNMEPQHFSQIESKNHISSKPLKNNTTTTQTNNTFKDCVKDCLVDFLESNKINTWPQKTNISCWWCCHTFDTRPIALPQSYSDNTFKVSGCFCSFNCAHAYNRSLKDPHTWERESLLKYMKRLIFPGEKDEIIAAPKKEILEAFGGTISIEQYRKQLDVIEQQYRLVIPPMISIVPQVEELQVQPQLKYTNTKAKANVPLDLKEVAKAINNLKSKRKPPNINSLQVTMGLIHE
tara:strand:+ start:14439 stop:15485 length:1047 start_codon:yes stop_codon:yes gene_type:complete